MPLLLLGMMPRLLGSESRGEVDFGGGAGADGWGLEEEFGAGFGVGFFGGRILVRTLSLSVSNQPMMICDGGYSAPNMKYFVRRAFNE